MESIKNEMTTQGAVEQLIEEDDSNNTETLSANESFEEEDNEVDKLLSQLDSSEEAVNVVCEFKQDTNLKTDGQKIETYSNEEIMKELKNLKKQNTITHSLLGVMIALTLAWQLSEVSLILRIKDGLSNPFKSVSGMISGFLKKKQSPNEVDIQQVINNNNAEKKELFILPGLKIPELPYLEFPGFDSSDEDN